MAYRNDCQGSIPLQAANCTLVTCVLRSNFSVWHPVQSCCDLPPHRRHWESLQTSKKELGQFPDWRGQPSLRNLPSSKLFSQRRPTDGRAWGGLNSHFCFPGGENIAVDMSLEAKAPEGSTWVKSLKSWDWPAVHILWGKSLEVVCCRRRGKVLWDESYCFMC